jgi:DNA primase
MSQVQEVKNAVDIIQLINERIPLQRSGSSWRGLCPFHSEKSPSFFVSDQLQRYKCFGCQEAGDILTFLEKYEGMTFAEALQYLADRAGITLTQYKFTSEDDQRQRILEILNLAKEYFHYLLTEHSTGEKARTYLKERGTTSDSIKLFQMGYALPAWDGLLKYLHEKKKYALADIEAAGLILQGSGGRYYDRFRDRVIFPLTDHRGRVVGFSGRVLDKTTKEAKYINSPETAVYHKSEMLFGFSQLYQFIRKENEVVVVEGEFDVISSAQAHVNNVVAVKGSAMTEQHMKLLARTVNKIILSFDMDSAGVTATKRAIEVARPFEMELRVIRLPDELGTKDPDDLARSQPQVWRQAVKSSISVYEFFLMAALKAHDATTPEGKRKIIDELAPIYGQITHAVELDYYTNKLAAALEVAVSVVKSDLLKFKQGKRKGLPANSLRKTEEKTDQPKPEKETRKSRLEEYALFLLTNADELTMQTKAEKLKHIHFTVPGAKQFIRQMLEAPVPLRFSEFVKNRAEDMQTLVADVSLNQKYLNMLPDLDIEKEWQKVMRELIDMDITDEIREMNKELELLENRAIKTDKDEARQNELLRKIVQLRAKQKQG